MSVNDLVELILEANNGDFKQTAEDINNLFVQFKLCSYSLVSEFEDICYKENKCPNCGSDLVLKTYEEDRGEYQGCRCEETTYEYYCPNCE